METTTICKVCHKRFGDEDTDEDLIVAKICPDCQDELEDGRLVDSLDDDLDFDFSDNPKFCKLCNGQVGHRVNCPNGIAFS